MAQDEYGPQLVAFRRGYVVHRSGRLFDDDFVHPTFFPFGDRTLTRADHGSEDAYGILVWSFEHGRIRDGAARHARVERRGENERRVETDLTVTLPEPP